MLTHKTQPDTPVTAAAERPRSRKHVGLVAGVAVVVLAAIGVYYAVFRSVPTTVSWSPSASAITPGSDLTVSGQITPAESGRQLRLESASSANGPWQRTPQTATTDSRGRFALTFKPQALGSIVVRAVVDPAGRNLKATSQPKTVRLLSLSSIGFKGGGLITHRNPVPFTVTVDPPVAGRTVRIEESSDKLRWVPVGSGRTKADGTLAMSVPAPGVGEWSYRATVVQDDSFAAALSPVVGAKVEDIVVTSSKATAAYARDLAHAVAVAERARQEKAAQAAADAAMAAAARESFNEPGKPNKPMCPFDQGPISGNWCRHSANGPDNPGYVMQCEIPSVPKYLWPAAVNGKCD